MKRKIVIECCNDCFYWDYIIGVFNKKLIYECTIKDFMLTDDNMEECVPDNCPLEYDN